MKSAESGNRVKVHYTGKLDNGEVFDSSASREPLEFVIDDGSMIKGFNEGVKGMALNEKKTIRIDAKDAYGEKREDMIINVERNRIPESIDLFVGLQLQMPQPGGYPVVVTVTHFDEEKVVLDANHRLAGEALNFDLELISLS